MDTCTPAASEGVQAAETRRARGEYKRWRASEEDPLRVTSRAPRGLFSIIIRDDFVLRPATKSSSLSLLLFSHAGRAHIVHIMREKPLRRICIFSLCNFDECNIWFPRKSW